MYSCTRAFEMTEILLTGTDCLFRSKGKSKKSASGSQTSEPKPTIGLQNEHVASTVSNGNSSPGANDTNAHPYTTAYDKRLSYCTSPSESVNSVSIDMENPSPLPQLPRRIPPKERQLRRRETRSKLMGSTHYEVCQGEEEGEMEICAVEMIFGDVYPA